MLSTEKAIEVLYTVRAYYASLTAGYPKGKDCKAIGDVMCSEIANSCLMAIKALRQEPCEDAISREDVLEWIDESLRRYGGSYSTDMLNMWGLFKDWIGKMPSVTPQQKVGEWIAVENEEMKTVGYYCSKCDLPMETEQRTKFCPNCGQRKMEVSENE